MIPSSPLKKNDLFQLTSIKGKIDAIDLKKASKIQILTQRSKKQFFVFIIFLIIVLICCFLQCPILASFESNEYVKKYYGKWNFNEYDVKSDFEKTTKFLINSTIFLASNRFNLTNELSHIPITFLRVRVKKNCANSFNFSCTQPIKINSLSNVSYYFEENEYFSTYINIYENISLEVQASKLRNILDDGFIDNSTEVIIDMSFLNPSTYLISYSELKYTVSTLGAVNKNFNNFSIRYNYYQTSLDIFRAFCEICFVCFYLFYLIANIIAIHYEIKHSKIIKQRTIIEENEEISKDKKICNICDYFYQICKGVWLYFARFGNIINLFTNIIGFIIILLWINFTYHNKLADRFETIDYNKFDYNSGFESFNSEISEKRYLENYGYYYWIGSFLYFQIIRFIIDIMRFFEIGNFYLILICNIIKKVIYLAIIFFVFLAAFAIFLKNTLGLQIGFLSDGYQAGLYLFRMMLSNDSFIEEMWAIAPLITVFFYIIFSLVITFVLLNMFLVITKNEFLALNHLFQTEKLEMSQKSKKRSNFDYKLGFCAKLRKVLFFVKLCFYFCCSKRKYEEIKKNNEIFQQQIKEESKIYSELEFDTNFKDFLKESNKEQKAFTDIEKFTLKKEKLKKFVIFIWKSIIMTCTFIIFSVLIVYYFDTSTNFAIINDVNFKITYNQPINTTLLGINSKSECIYFLEKSFPSYFSQYIYLENENSTISSQNINYAIFDYVYLVNNVIRLTVRKRKYEPIEPELKTLFPYKITPTFSRNSIKNENLENTTDIYIKELNRTIPYNTEESFMGLGGYVIYENPSNMSFSKLINGLNKYDFFDMSMNSIVVDFIVASFQEKGRFIKCNIYFEWDDAGNVNANVYVMSFFRNAIEEVYDVLVLATLVLISILYLMFFLKSIRDIISRKHNYDTWYTLYIKNRLPKVLLYHREMKNAELIRKIQFIFNYKMMINISFLIFGGGFLIAVGVYELQIFLFESNAMIFDQSVKNFLYNHIFVIPDSSQYIINHYGIDLNKASHIMETNGFIIFFASCTAFTLACKIIFYYSKNEKFYLIIQSLRVSFLDFLLVFCIFMGVLIAFTVCTYFSFGTKYEPFSSFDQAYYNLLVPMVYFENLGANLPPEDKVLFVMLLLPYFLIFRLIFLNLIISIMFKHFQSFRKEGSQYQQESIKINISAKEFFYVTFDLLKFIRKKNQTSANQRKNHDIILQTLQKVNIHLPFIAMKNSIKDFDRLKNVNVWADICSEEIKFEYDSRKFLKDKCDEITKNVLSTIDEFGEDPNYIQLNKIHFKRIPIEFELRKVYWEYFRIAHLYLHRYDFYLQQKIDAILKIRKVAEIKNELNFLKNEAQASDEKKKNHKENEINEIKELNKKDLVLKMEEKLKKLNELRQEEKRLKNLYYQVNNLVIDLKNDDNSGK